MSKKSLKLKKKVKILNGPIDGCHVTGGGPPPTLPLSMFINK